jgi:single-strand DNA-binding protein
MSNLNKVFLMGRLTRDPELRYTPQGMPVSDLGLAVNREFTTQGGERRKDTLFIDVTVWKKQAELCCQYLKKGNPLFIEGRLSMDSWEGQDGQKRTKIRVVAENFQFIGGGSGKSGTAGEPAGEMEESGPPGGGDSAVGREYGSSFRRPQKANGGPAPASLPATDEFGPGQKDDKEDEVPF